MGTLGRSEEGGRDGRAAGRGPRIMFQHFSAWLNFYLYKPPPNFIQQVIRASLSHVPGPRSVRCICCSGGGRGTRGGGGEPGPCILRACLVAAAAGKALHGPRAAAAGVSRQAQGRIGGLQRRQATALREPPPLLDPSLWPGVGRRAAAVASSPHQSHATRVGRGGPGLPGPAGKGFGEEGGLGAGGIAPPPPLGRPP